MTTISSFITLRPFDLPKTEVQNGEKTYLNSSGQKKDEETKPATFSNTKTDDYSFGKTRELKVDDFSFRTTREPKEEVLTEEQKGEKIYLDSSGQAVFGEDGIPRTVAEQKEYVAQVREEFFDGDYPFFDAGYKHGELNVDDNSQTKKNIDLDDVRDNMPRPEERTVEQDYRANNPFGTHFGPAEFEDNPKSEDSEAIDDVKESMKNLGVKGFNEIEEGKAKSEAQREKNGEKSFVR